MIYKTKQGNAIGSRRFGNKKILLIILAVLIIFLVAEFYTKVFSSTLTGLVSGVISLSTSVFPTTEGIILFDAPSSITRGDTAFITVEFKNTGTTTVNESMQIQIKNSGLVSFVNFSDSNRTLFPGESIPFRIFYTPNATETHFIVAQAAFGNQTIEANTSFKVASPPPVTVTIQAPAASSAASPAAPSVVSPVSKMELEYLQFITLTRNQSSLISVLAKNVGGTDLNNLILTAFSKDLLIETKPVGISLLKSNSPATFLISVKVPKEISLGTYTIDFILTSDKVSDKGQIIVKVEAMEKEVEIGLTLINYQSLIDSLTEEASRLSKEAKNTDATLEILKTAQDELNEAKQLFDNREFEKAGQKLFGVKAKIEQSTEKLSKVLRPKIVFVPFPKPEIVAPIAGTAVLSTYYYYRQKKEKEKYRKSIRKAIDNIKKGEQ